MTELRQLIVERPAAMVGDVAGAGAIVLLLIAALHLPALL